MSDDRNNIDHDSDTIDICLSKLLEKCTNCLKSSSASDVVDYG